MNYRLITDSSANLPLKMLENNNVSCISLPFCIGGKKEMFCPDVKKFDAKRYYERLKNGLKITTSQIGPEEYIKHFEDVLKEGQDILYLSMSSGVSGTYNNAVFAANELKEKYPERKILVLDTKASSLGEGLIVLHAIDNRDKGLSIEENYKELTEYVDSMYAVFTVDSPEPLEKSGRVKEKCGIIDNVLGIKNIFKGNIDGKIEHLRKVRSSKKAIEYMAEKYNSLVKDAKNQIVCINHANNESGARLLSSLINRLNPPKKILEVPYEPVTGAHVGSGAIALYFIGDKGVRKN